MKFLSRCRYKTLTLIWAGLYVLTGLLGVLLPGQEQLLLRLALAGFFVPPWLILAKARREGQVQYIRRIRYLSLGWLMLAVAFLLAGILSLGWGETAGTLLHIAMSLVCAPLACGDFYALALFGWAGLLFSTFQKG